MIAVSDTGPLIALAKVDRLALLHEMFGQVLVPSAVERELIAKHGGESVRLEAALRSFLQPVPAPVLAPDVRFVTTRLDLGEQEAIALAYERRSLLVIDDRLGRAAARRLGLVVTGVVGVLVQAKQAGLVAGVRPLLDEMRRRGYWLSDEILDAASRLAGEA
jgi:predicted nucleic acid-binding protein